MKHLTDEQIIKLSKEYITVKRRRKLKEIAQIDGRSFVTIHNILKKYK